MISCDVPPLTYNILSQTLQIPDQVDSFITKMPETVYKKIIHFSDGSFSGHLRQKTMEYVHMLITARYLFVETGKVLEFKLALFTSDVMNGVDVRLSVNNSRTSADLTALGLMEDKIRKYNNRIILEDKLRKHGKGRAGDIGEKLGKILIGIPLDIHRLSRQVIANSTTIEEARNMIDCEYSKNQDITILGLNECGKKWVAKNIYN